MLNKDLYAKISVPSQRCFPFGIMEIWPDYKEGRNGSGVQRESLPFVTFTVVSCALQEEMRGTLQ